MRPIYTGRSKHHPTILNDSVLEFDRSLVQKLIHETEYEAPETADGQLVRALRMVWEHELTVTQRRYMGCYYYRRMTMTAIAADCGVNVSTVSRTVRRAKQRLIRTMQPFLRGSL